MSDAVIVAVVSGCVALASAILSFVGSQSAAKKTNDLIAYRLEQLENRVAKHNNLIDRMYKCEARLDIYEKEIDILKGEYNDGK